MAGYFQLELGPSRPERRTVRIKAGILTNLNLINLYISLEEQDRGVSLM